MAPASPARHVWIWSGALALLLSFVWYTRRRSSLKSDPGGTGASRPSTPASQRCQAESREAEPCAEEEEVTAETSRAEPCAEEEVTAESSRAEPCGEEEVTAETSRAEVTAEPCGEKEATAETSRAEVTAEPSGEKKEATAETSRKEATAEPLKAGAAVEPSKEAEAGAKTETPEAEEEPLATRARAEEVEASPVSSSSAPAADMKESGKQEPAAAAVESQEEEEEAVKVDEALQGKLASLALSEEQSRAADRDSANHSPADAMLASPSMSSYSDEHSEGSSDSGKGCSDVASPPSRTPVGSGSLAGDADSYAGVDPSNSFSIYEFLLPQILVGRLIGRQGSYVQEIKSKTNAHIWIKKHPESSKQKICSIEGTPADIDSALGLIRERFPLRKYPSVTLEQVSFVPAACTFPLVPDFCQLHLVEGVNNEVMISSLVSPAHMFLQQPYHPSYQFLQRLNHLMNSVYAHVETPNLPDPIEAGNICVAPAIDGWYRAQVVSSNEESQTSEIKFVDYGGYMTVNNSVLRQIRQDFMTLPFQAVECYLANIKPAGETTEWSLEALRIVEELTRGQMLLAQVYDYANDGIPLIYLYSSINSQPWMHDPEVVLINQDLVARGLADLDDTVCSASSAEAASLVVAAAEAAAAAAAAAGATITTTTTIASDDAPSSPSECKEDNKTVSVEATPTPEVAAT